MLFLDFLKFYLIHQYASTIGREIPAVKMVVHPCFFGCSDCNCCRCRPESIEMAVPVQLVIDDVAHASVGEAVNTYGIDCIIDCLR